MEPSGGGKNAAWTKEILTDEKSLCKHNQKMLFITFSGSMSSGRKTFGRQTFGRQAHKAKKRVVGHLT